MVARDSTNAGDGGSNPHEHIKIVPCVYRKFRAKHRGIAVFEQQRCLTRSINSLAATLRRQSSGLLRHTLPTTNTTSIARTARNWQTSNLFMINIPSFGRAIVVLVFALREQTCYGGGGMLYLILVRKIALGAYSPNLTKRRRWNTQKGRVAQSKAP